jgi:hypothetical protein
MKLIIYSVIFIGWLLYLSEPIISFKPFSIEFGKPYMPFAWLFLITAVVLFQIQSDKIAYRRGINDTIEIVKEELKKK